MPVEIKELVIRAVVQQDDQSASGGAAHGPAIDIDREAIVEDCARRVLQILKTTGER